MSDFKIYSRGIVKNSDGNILLLKKKSNQKIGGGAWLLPGGTMEYGENIEHTLIREIKEETNLEVQSIELVLNKKMLIDKSHWLGAYYLCTVKDESALKNLEPDKHDTVGYFPLHEIFELRDYMMIKMAFNFPKEYYDITSVEALEHSMQLDLEKYIDAKVHTLIKDNIDSIAYIKIIGNYDRSHSVSKEEKCDKLFNYKRPTAFLDDDVLYLLCFPSIDYIKHYTNIIASYFVNKGIPSPLISYRLPTKEFIYQTYEKCGVLSVPEAEIIIFGNVDKIGLFTDIDFQKRGDFHYKLGNINGKKVMLLGCEFSVWGNAGYYLINSLVKNFQFNKFIYVGKLGILDNNTEPNSYLATGDTSYIGNKKVSWNNIFENQEDSKIKFGSHITCPSVIEETIYNIGKYRKKGLFIDPEIGNMALGCNKNNIDFSYLHIISDNVIVPHIENLSNERKTEILKKRKKLFLSIGGIIKDTL
ncbi:NUDIX hydrolase [Candidatus Gracilibacteria bacterium]|nr:NUDIX hydrolase [Candidatus Gracilibacteria bacterium]